MSFEIKPEGDGEECKDEGCSCRNGWIIECSSDDGTSVTKVVVPDVTAAANFVFTSLYAAERMGLKYTVSLKVKHTGRSGPVSGSVPDFLPPDIGG